MSRFFSNKYQKLTPYTPGEQPKDMQYIKLNTNESPFPPAPRAVELAAEAAKKLQLYSDPEVTDATKALAELITSKLLGKLLFKKCYKKFNKSLDK